LRLEWRIVRVIVTMPAYKAARTIARTCREIPAGSYDEVLVVDDCSPDETVQVAQSMGLPTKRHEANRGYGGNQKTCYDWALDEGADIVVLLHPDYPYAPQRVPALAEPIRAGRADFPFGSRFAAGGRPMAGGLGGSVGHAVYRSQLDYTGD
jgi:glycosyltransferase involved in cell wall biosynthesis